MRAFTSLRRAVSRFWKDESGTTAVEYAVLVAFICLLCAAAATAFQSPAGSALDSSTTTIGTYPDP